MPRKKATATATAAAEPKPAPTRKRSKRKPPEPHIVNEAPASRCPNCDSTSRSDYQNTVRRRISGIDDDGRPFEWIVWRSCRCLKCGQWRRDKTHETE
jgi:hypothetical protein